MVYRSLYFPETPRPKHCMTATQLTQVDYKVVSYAKKLGIMLSKKLISNC